MKKYGLDEGQMYVEQSTLLEPNNFIPSWEAGDEEKKEVSLALKKLRKKYDDIHKMTVEKENDLELLKVSAMVNSHPCRKEYARSLKRKGWSRKTQAELNLKRMRPRRSWIGFRSSMTSKSYTSSSTSTCSSA